MSWVNKCPYWYDGREWEGRGVRCVKEAFNDEGKLQSNGHEQIDQNGAKKDEE